MKLAIQVQDIYKNYGPQHILEGASAAFSYGQKIGVIGRNGAGKTTLCRMILGLESPDAGQITKASDLRLGYLEQGDSFLPEETALDFLVRNSEAEPWQCGQVAGQFQLKGDVFEKLPVAGLPGGFQTRVKLAAMLLKEPNFLILDEPTNYLDVRTQVLFEAFLKDFQGGALVVSHDRAFLRRSCDHTLQVSRGRISMFAGNIDAYFANKAERDEVARRSNRKIEARKRQLQDFVDRNRVRAATASQAQSKMKMLERLETIDIEEDDNRAAAIRLPEVPEKHGLALRCDGLSIGYPNKNIASGIDLVVERGQRVAVVGDNGQGKTTFLRTLASDLKTLAGSITWGHEMGMSYYAQHVYSSIAEAGTVESYLKSRAPRSYTRQNLLDLAGAFLFSGEAVEKPLNVLSGGERARLCLLGMLLNQKPLLLLDEPNNHLDFDTVEALADALAEFKGTVFFVSHDRSFVEKVANSVVEVKDGKVRFFPGTYAQYLYRLEKEIQESADQPPSKKPSGSKSEKGKAEKPRGAKPSGDKISDPEKRKEAKAQLRQAKKDLEKAESRMASLEAERQQILDAFCQSPNENVKDRKARLAVLERELKSVEAQWLGLGQEVEELESQVG